MTGGLNEASPDRNEPPFYFTSSALQEDLLSHSAFPFLCNNLPLHMRASPTSLVSRIDQSSGNTSIFHAGVNLHEALASAQFVSIRSEHKWPWCAWAELITASLSVCFHPFLLWFLYLSCQRWLIWDLPKNSMWSSRSVKSMKSITFAKSCLFQTPTPGYATKLVIKAATLWSVRAFRPSKCWIMGLVLSDRVVNLSIFLLFIGTKKCCSTSACFLDAYYV